MSIAATLASLLEMKPAPQIESTSSASFCLDQIPEVADKLLNSLMEGQEPSLPDYAKASLPTKRIVQMLEGHYACTPELAKLTLRYMLLLASCDNQIETAWCLAFDQNCFQGYSELPLNLQSVVESFIEWPEEREKFLNQDPTITRKDLLESIPTIDKKNRPLVVAAGLLVEICRKASKASQKESLQFVALLQEWMANIPEEAPLTSDGLLIDQSKKA